MEELDQLLTVEYIFAALVYFPLADVGFYLFRQRDGPFVRPVWIFNFIETYLRIFAGDLFPMPILDFLLNFKYDAPG
jgi:hypothetical protein